MPGEWSRQKKQYTPGVRGKNKRGQCKGSMANGGGGEKMSPEKKEAADCHSRITVRPRI